MASPVISNAEAMGSGKGRKHKGGQKARVHKGIKRMGQRKSGRY